MGSLGTAARRWSAGSTDLRPHESDQLSPGTVEWPLQRRPGLRTDHAVVYQFPVSLEGLDDLLGIRAKDSVDRQLLALESTMTTRAGDLVQPTLKPSDHLAPRASAQATIGKAGFPRDRMDRPRHEAEADRVLTTPWPAMIRRLKMT